MPHKSSEEILQFTSPNASQKNSEWSKIDFTDVSIKNLKPVEKRKMYWFKGYKGFGIRVSPSGSKTFVYMYSLNARTRWLTIGKYPKISIAKALKEYADGMEKYQLGYDPAQERKKDNIEFRETPTFSQVVKSYVEYSKKTGKKTWDKEARYFERDAVPYIGWHKIDSVKRKEIARLVNKVIYERGAKHSACELLQYLKRLFNVAIGWGLCEHNPCYHIPKPARTTRRARVLLPDEIYRFWNNLDNAKVIPIVKLALKFTILTMARKSEVRFCEWSHINLNTKTWVLPSTHTKNGRSHTVPLSDLAIEIIQEAFTYTGQSQFVFGSTRLPPNAKDKTSNLKPLNKTAMSHALRRNISVFKVSENFNVHDLRRTGATLITGLGCPRYWASLLLNHTDSSVTSIYDRYSYDWEKHCGMDVLGYSIKRIIDSPSEELVPTLRLLRTEIEKKGILKFRYNYSEKKDPLP